jgi:hypothetical protein
VETTLEFLRKVRWVLLASIGLYTIVCLRAPAVPAPKLLVLRAIELFAIAILAGIFFLRRKLILTSEAILFTQANEPAALARLRAGYVLTWALCEAIALYAVVLRYMGFTFSQVIPLLMGGFLLMLFISPRRPNEH